MRPDDNPPRPRSSRRTWTRDQLLKSLQIIGELHTPLPPTLPPSPPVSRSNSPAPTIKRKYDAPSEHERSKRPRTTSILSDRPAPPSDTHIRVHPARNEPCEDGEVREDPPVASSSRIPVAPGIAIPNAVPIRRPRRGKMDAQHHEALHDKYHQAGRLLKYSGDSRFWSTFAVGKKEYKPLANPPPPNSMYHKFGGLIARLELVDALVCFTYAMWNRDYAKKTCYRNSWSTIEAFLTWCKQKWLTEEVIDAERSFIGLIYMIEGFIHVRKMAYFARMQLDRDVSKLCDDLKAEVDQAAAKADESQLSENLNLGLGGQKPQATPPMLPSPESIASANSANSTPTARDEGTPSSLPPTGSATQKRAPHPPGQQLIHGRLLPQRYRDVPIPADTMDAMLSATTTASLPFLQNIKEQTNGTLAAAHCLREAQTTLNLTTLVRFYPTTFARIINTTLSPTEEHEPDIEDEEGELYWPGQGITGEGLGWVCLLGKAMIKEFGKKYGYKGIDGVVSKPNPEDAGSRSLASGPQQHQRSGSTPSGRTPHGSTPHGYSSQPPPSSTLPR
ncbi:hypothetical protein H0H87_000718 [Tephrocybe sp. NHM501043]|nr:hypothetical protein H0H87_000718 [Tephrocybe sp. NHM501043]